MSDCPDCSTLSTQIAEAKAAYHQLMLGNKKVSVTFGPSKRVEYTQATKADLKGYIAELQDLYSACCTASTKTRGPIRFTF